MSVVLCPYDHGRVSVVGSLNAPLSGKVLSPGRGGVCIRLLGRPVGDLPTLQHGPPVSLHVVDQGDEDGRAHQQLERGQKD